LTELAAEIASLRQTVQVLERNAGLGSSRLPQAERRRQVVQLREQGLRARRIAATVGVHRQTIMRDARELGLPPPARTLVVDGVTRRHAQR
jgi:hypothetical protein